VNQPLYLGRLWGRMPFALQIVAAALLYTGVAHLSLALALPGSNASPVWPPTGLAVALLLLGGLTMWPAIALGALAANLIDFASHGPLLSSHYLAATAIAGGNTLEAWVAACLMRKCGGADAIFRRMSGVLKFVLICPLASAISASIGTESLVLTGTLPAALGSTVWLTWFLGDLTGMALVVPLIVAWRPSHNAKHHPPKPWMESALVLAAAYALWIAPLGLDTHARLYLIVLVPLLAWLTFQYGLRGGTTGALFLVGSAVLAITQGQGTLGGNANDLFLQLDVVLIIFATLVLLLGADIATRRDSGANLDWRGLAITWGALLIGCALTLFLWHLNVSRIESEADKRLLRRSERVVTALQGRIQDYQQVIKGGANLFLGRPSVSRTVWHDYAQTLDLHHAMPAVLGIGFAEVIAPDALAPHTQRIRAEGFPSYTVRPSGPRDTYSSIIYIEPFDPRNQRAFGFDMLTEPTRRLAMLTARDTGSMTASGRVTLRQENGLAEQAGVVLYMPVYRQQRDLDTVAQRQAALIGFSTAAFRVGDMVKLALTTELDGLDIAIYDTAEALPKNRLFPLSSGPGDADAPVGAPTFQKTMDIGNRLWTVQLRATPSFWKSVDHTASRLTLVFGMLLSVGMFLLLRTLASARAQQQQTAHFRSVIELAPSALIMVNETGTIEMVNAPVERMFGYPRSELLGQPVEMLIPAQLRDLHVHLRHEFSQHASQRPMGRGRDLFGLCKDGSEIALEIGLSPLSNADGKKVLCGFVDVTERKRHEAALLKTSRELERTNAFAKVGGWVVDLRTNAIIWSDETCRIHDVELGYQPTLEAGIAFYAPEARPVIEKAVQDAIATGQGWDLELPFITAKSRPIWVRALGEAEFENGVPVRLVGAFQDITERKIRTVELARRNQELDKFAYIASHDLKSPLRGIDQLAKWLFDDLGDTINAESQEHLRLMRVRIGRMENLLDGLLAYARAGRVEGMPEAVDLNDLVTEIFDLCHNHEQFDLRLEGDFPVVQVAKSPLAMVFRNLIGNAIKHHDQTHGVITVSIKAQDKHLEIVVADDGPGIPAEHTTRAFDMFQTLRPRDEVEGSGIGLAIVKKSLEAMGSSIALTPNSPRGARFSFNWPIADLKP
jgi:PAS domain S-box-containing protein